MLTVVPKVKEKLAWTRFVLPVVTTGPSDETKPRSPVCIRWWKKSPTHTEALKGPPCVYGGQKGHLHTLKHTKVCRPYPSSLGDESTKLTQRQHQNNNNDKHQNRGHSKCARERRKAFDKSD